MRKHTATAERKNDPARKIIIGGIFALLVVFTVLIIIALRREKSSEVSADVSAAAPVQDRAAGMTLTATPDRTAVLLSAEAEPPSDSALTHQEKWSEGSIRYKGDVYRFNWDLTTYLFMGIDSDQKVARSEDSVSGGQSDAMFLLVIDDKQRKASVISINRNTMTDIVMLDEKGRDLGTFTAQLCLQHGYGDGMQYSCDMTVEAVEYLFYDIPIRGYMALNMGGLGLLNDAIGGVYVRIPEDYRNEACGLDYKAGETVLMDGPDAYNYVRRRDVTEFDSATKRLKRDEAYLLGLITSMKSYIGRDDEKALKVFDTIRDYTVTDIDFSDMASKLGGYSFGEADVYSLSGTTEMGSEFEEFYVNEIELWDLIINIFYDKV